MIIRHPYFSVKDYTPKIPPTTFNHLSLTHRLIYLVLDQQCKIIRRNTRTLWFDDLVQLNEPIVKEINILFGESNLTNIPVKTKILKTL